MRLFWGLHLDPATHAALAQLQAQLGRGDLVRWTKPENFHITLHFLGEASADESRRLVTALTAPPLAPSPPGLVLRALGGFPNARQARVVWAGPEEVPPVLPALRQAVLAASRGIGRKPETRPWRPHVTLGYVREGLEEKQRAEVTALLSSPWGGVSATITSLALIASETGPGGSRYTDLASWRLYVSQSVG